MEIGYTQKKSDIRYIEIIYIVRKRNLFNTFFSFIRISIQVDHTNKSDPKGLMVNLIIYPSLVFMPP